MFKKLENMAIEEKKMVKNPVVNVRVTNEVVWVGDRFNSGATPCGST